MGENRTGRAVKNSIAAIGCKALLVIIPFIVRAVIIQKLGIEYLGLNSLFTSILTMLSLSELGFSSAIIYEMYKPIADNDTDTVCALMTFYKKIYRMVGCVITLIGLAILPFIKHLIASDYPEDINIYVVYLVFLLNTCLSYFLFAYKTSILVASMRSDLDSIITTITQVLMYVFQVFVLLTFENYYIYAIAFPAFTIVNNIIRSVIVDRKFPHYKKVIAIDENKKREIVKKVGALFGHKVGGVIFSSFDTIVISSFLGLIVLGKYTNYYYIYTSVNAVISLIFNSILAVIGNSIACRSAEENLVTFKQLVLINSWLTGFISCLFISLYQPFIQLWLGNKYLLDMIIPILLSFYFYVFSYRRVILVFKDAAGMWEADKIKPYVSAVTNLVINIILVNVIGLPGVVISSIIAVVFVEMPWETKVLFDKYFNSTIDEYVSKALLSFGTTVITCVFMWFLGNYMQDNIEGIIIRFFSCAIIYSLFVYVVSRKTNEFNELLQKTRLLMRGDNK